jgi:predicted DNA-binding transcriptional regulator YafY
MVELHLKLSSLPEVQRWLMGWAGKVTIISPAELVDAVREAAQQVLQKHP